MVCATARAQVQVWERVGNPQLSSFFQPNNIAVVVGDLDTDGYEDIVQSVNAPDPQLWFFSGRDGSTLRRRQSQGLHGYYTLTRAGDMDGDGNADYAVTIVGPNAMWTTLDVRSAQDDRLLWDVTTLTPQTLFGWSLLGDIDLDGDGRPNLLVTLPRGSPYGEIRAYTHDGRELYTVRGTPQLEVGIYQQHCTLGKVGDVDGDGGEDFVSAAIDGVAGVWAAAVISGRTGRVLVTGLGRPDEFVGSATVDGCGDIDGDGVPDFVAGGTALGYPGVAVAFSGRTGQRIYTWVDWTWVIKGGGIDMDRDGVPDVVVGAPNRPLVGYSGRDGSMILRQFQELQGVDQGKFLATIRPRPGNPFGQFVVVDSHYRVGTDPTPVGRLRVLRASPPRVTSLGDGCVGTLGQTPKMGLTNLGWGQSGNFNVGWGVRVHLSNALPGAPAVLLLGLSSTSYNGVSLPAPLDAIGFAGCQLRVGMDVVLLTSTGITGKDRGYARFDIPLPLALPSVQGVALHGQWVSFGAGATWPGAVSDAMGWYH